MQEYSIGALSKRSGVPVKVIRFYAGRGLLPPARTAPSGYRYYTDRELERLHQIAGLRSLGASLRQIEALLAGNVTLSDVLAAQRTHVAAEQDRLQRLEVRLAAAQRALMYGEEAVWTHLLQVREMMQESIEERRVWLEQWWRRQLDGRMPAEELDRLVETAKSMVSTQEASPAAAAVWSGLWMGTRSASPAVGPELPGTPREAGLATDETWDAWFARVAAAQREMDSAKNQDPANPAYQAALCRWISCFGPLTRTTVQHFLAQLDSALAQSEQTPPDTMHFRKGLRCLEQALTK